MDSEGTIFKAARAALLGDGRTHDLRPALHEIQDPQW